jgi:Uma2 family endonuclease
MALKHQNHPISKQDYLAGELLSDIKHEYIDGRVFAMAGVSKNHDRITINIARQFGNHLENTPCDVFSSDVKVKAAGNFFYPDVMVVCDDQTEHEYYSESPVIIVEVLSKTTRRTDQTVKRLAYQNLPSLREYVLIEQDFVDVEVCRRDNHWQSEHYFLGDEVHFAAIDLRFPVEAIYARVVNEDMREYLAGREETLKPEDVEL